MAAKAEIFVVAALLFSLVLISPVPAVEAARSVQEFVPRPVRPPICPQCVCCEPPPPGRCCDRCCASPLVPAAAATP